MRYDHSFRERGYHSAFLTTYSFDPIAFENVALLNLRGAGCRNIAIIADGRMANLSFTEVGVPELAGLDYHLAKKTIPAAFHPKLLLQLGASSGRLMVGSANLTSSGLAGNLEVVAPIQVTPDDRSKAPLLSAALAYFRKQADPDDLAMRRALERAIYQTPWLAHVQQETEVTVENEHRVAFLHDTSEISIADAFVNFIGADKISRIVIISPFWDNTLKGVSAFRYRLGDPAVALVPDLSAQDFSAETILALDGITLHSPAELGVSETRRLHAKLIIACGQHADYVLTGSMNASRPGLFGRGAAYGNAEAAIARTLDPGMAIEILALGQTLETELPLEKLRPREIHISQEKRPNIQDGGSVTIKQAQVHYKAPSSDSGVQTLKLFDRSSNVLCLFNLKPKNGLDQFTLPEGLKTVPKIALVTFVSGKQSAPIPIALLDILERSSRPPLPPRERAILDSLAETGEVTDELLSLLSQLGRMSAENVPEKPLKIQQAPTRKDDDNEEDNRRLSEDDFLATSGFEGAVANEKNIRTLEEIRRAINHSLGLVEGFADVGEAEDRLLRMDVNVSNAGAKADGDANGDKGGPDGYLQSKSLTKVLKTSSAKRDAVKFEKSLRNTGLYLCRVLAGQTGGTMNLAHSLLFRVFIMSVLNAATSGVPTERYPIPPLSESGGWIRLLGRVLVKYFKFWSSLELLSRELEDHQLEALGLALNAGSLLAQTAKHPLIIKPIMQTYGQFARAVDATLTGTDTEVYLKRISSRYASQKDFVRLTE